MRKRGRPPAIVNNVYALYKGETFLAEGTIAEISEQTGKSENYLIYMTYPIYHKRRKEDGNSMLMVLLEDEDDYDE